jgi:hypothetical protein
MDRNGEELHATAIQKRRRGRLVNGLRRVGAGRDGYVAMHGLIVLD